MSSTARSATAATGDTKEWCIGVESGGDSGWPGTDWIEDIVLRQAGTDVYDAWVAGQAKWTVTRDQDGLARPSVTPSRTLTAAPQYVNSTNFGKAANPMFTTPPGCLLHHQASFITDFFKNEAKAQPTDYNFFQLPRHRPRVRRQRHRRRRPVRHVQRHARRPSR